MLGNRMRKGAIFLIAFFVLTLVFVFPPQTYAQAVSTVNISNFQFSPATLTIPVGTTVTWRNTTSGTTHTTTSDSNIWSQQLGPGQSFSRTFITTGTFPYHCNIHTNMRATIIVTASTPPPLSTATPTPDTSTVPSPVCLGSCPVPSSAATATPTPRATSRSRPTPRPRSTARPTFVPHVPQNHELGCTEAKKPVAESGFRGWWGRWSDGWSHFWGGFMKGSQQKKASKQSPSTTDTPCPSPTTVPTPSTSSGPTAAPTPAPTLTPASTLGRISVADLKYFPNDEPLKSFDLFAEANGDRWTYGLATGAGTIPGPLLRVNQGDHFHVNVHNQLPESTTIHWHGIVPPNSQDGVSGATQNSIPSGTIGTYDFVASDSGTYWYHTHHNTAEQLTKVLNGMLIVDHPVEPVHYDRDYSIVYRNKETGPIQLEANPGENVRLRVLDAREPEFSPAIPIKMAIVGIPFKVISVDGHDINEPQNLESQIIHIGLSQRYDLAFTMPASRAAQLLEQENLQQVTIGNGALPTPPNLNTLPEFSLINYGVHIPDPRLPKTTFDSEFTFTIGPDLSINGKVMPNVPNLVNKQGQLVHVHFVNNSPMTHPMHLHGHIFSVLKVNEVPVTGSPIHTDTILIKPGETADVAFIADALGVWMFHCHILAHAAGGLAMFQSYDNVYTPYVFGPGTGNIPD